MTKTHMMFTGKIAVTILASFSLFAAAQTASAAIVYDALPNPLPPNAPSQPFQAQQTFEFGDYVHLGGTDRVLTTVTVAMSDWALYADYAADIRYSGDSVKWTHPITINIYSNHLGANGAPDTLLATKTESIDIPWRPVADPTCPTPTAWRAANNNCYNGYAFNATFDLSSLNVTLPTDIIVGIAYDTQTYGVSPIGSNGPYNSLNVLVPDNQPVSVGSDDSAGAVFWNTSTAAWYADGGAAGVNIFRQDDTHWIPNGTVAMQINAITPLPPSCPCGCVEEVPVGPSGYGHQITLNGISIRVKNNGCIENTTSSNSSTGGNTAQGSRGGRGGRGGEVKAEGGDASGNNGGAVAGDGGSGGRGGVGGTITSGVAESLATTTNRLNFTRTLFRFVGGVNSSY